MVIVQRANMAVVDGAPAALVLPGARYTVHAPLLYWPILALIESGWDVWCIDWHSGIETVDRQDIAGFMKSALARAEELMPAQPELVIAKSLGTYALPHFATRQVKAAWLTPILSDPAIADAFSGMHPGQHLVIGGTADPSWHPDLMGSTDARVISIDSANHRLETASMGWRTSADTGLNVIETIIDHLGIS
ncbi:hypothetical protein [Arthrobacter sp. 260]|uniref:hypothetical protein n=1 Tax=Arthrobacter sp. 260 TaxID=2735314 RepID=UPI001492385C|nr:hypothetical protein [Arthrobacter sp. 260]NOJ61136.1 hypothetical protein [Arthrobacter sp. 260]